MATWLLPDNLADILPHQARILETMRRQSLDLYAAHGFEAVEPPLLEFVASLLTGSGTDVENNTFKFMDQAGGRMVGLRADITPQIARIDAHILNSTGVSRLCYAATCLHARPMHPLASREPFVAGAELFGCPGLEADQYMLRLAVTNLRVLGVKTVHVDVGHTGLVRALLKNCDLTAEELHALIRALRMKDPTALAAASEKLPAVVAQGLQTLLVEFGDASCLERLREKLPNSTEIARALSEVERVAQDSGADEVSFDFCDVHGYQYLTGVTFSVNIPEYAQAVLRGGRYDGVGLAYGRARPACGFTVYLRELASVFASKTATLPEAVVAGAELKGAAYQAAAEKLRSEGRTVVHLLPGESRTDVEKRFKVTHQLVQGAAGIELEALAH